MRYVVVAMETVVVCAMVAVVGLVVTEVVLRYIFLTTLVFPEELTRYLMIWVTFVAGALCVLERSHVRIEFFLGLMGPRLRRLCEALALVLAIGFLSVLAYEGFRVLPRIARQDTMTLGVSIKWFYLAIPCGAVLMALFMAFELWRMLRGLPRPVEKD